MGSYHQDPSMMDIGNLGGDMLNNSVENDMGLDSFQEDIEMDLGSQVNPMFHPSEALSGPLSENNLMKDSSEGLISGNPAGNALSGAGAGPLPTGFGTQSTSNAGSTLTEFTKRRNWSQRVIEELKDMLYILTPDARFLYVSPSSKALTGHDPQELVGKFMTDCIHQDDSSLFIREFNESIASGQAIRFFFRFRTVENKFLVLECHGHPHLASDASSIRLGTVPGNTAGYCRGFFMMARPYPTKNAELLDSFLEHKIENERLRARIEALQREEQEENETQQRHYHKKANGHDSVTPTNSNEVTPPSPTMSIPSRRGSADLSSMPPPAKPTISNTALTREALDEANAFSRPDSITDKMARYEGSSQAYHIELLTGLRFREGERSLGISTGGTSPALIRGDAGIEIPADKTDSRYGGGPGSMYMDKKPKKLKSAEEYVCTDCGTLDSPEWRKGPNGPKTLCNACGLRWAKKEKKRTGPSSGGNEGGESNPGSGSGQGSNPQASTVPGLKQSNSNGSG